VYNSLITFLDDIPIKYESSETTSYGILGKPIQYLSCSRSFGVKESGFGRENHKMALDHYRVVKQVNLYDKEPVEFFN
jgi:acyl-CoA reductase-like NAD-dependent aldehyde dehydrogenase